MGGFSPGSNPGSPTNFAVKMIIIFTGNGKGKTSAALGVAFRALGYGKKVIFAQFLKGLETGEVKAAEKFRRNLFFYLEGNKEFLTKSKERKGEKLMLKTRIIKEADKKKVRKFLEKIIEESKKKRPFLLILDEINICLQMGLVDLSFFLSKLKEVSKETNIIITGRQAPEELIKVADLVTEMKEVKHYFQKGRLAMKGIDF